MVGRARGRGRGNQAQHIEMAEMRRMMEDLSRAVQALQRQERADAYMEIPERNRGPLHIPEGGGEDEYEDETDVDNLFHEAGNHGGGHRGGLEERLVRALDLNGGGIKIEVVDFYGKMHVEDYLDWEASLENYFEWKPMAEDRKVLFVKLKLKSTALQWWKRVEEQRARQGKQKINTWDRMKSKLRKQFLPADYTMELYEQFHNLKQRDMSVEEYTSEFNNLSIRVGLNETNEQMTSRYLSGLNQTIRDEMGVVRLFNLEDARQYALMAERRLSRHGGKRAVSSHPDTGSQSDEEANPSTRIGGRNSSANKSEKGKETTQFHPPNDANVKNSKAGSTSQARCFNCGEAGYKSYACPQRRINLVGDKINFPEPSYDVYGNEEEVIDLLLVEGECLLVRRVMTTPKVEEEDWRRHNIFRTRVLCGEKVCNVIFDGGSSENIISKEAVEKLKLPIEKHPNPYKVAWFRKGSEVPITSRCLVKFTIGNTIEDEAWCDSLEEGLCHEFDIESKKVASVYPLVTKKDVEGASNKLEDDNILNLENPPMFDYCLEEDCEVCLGIEKAFDKVFDESKQAESSVILKAVNHEEAGFELLKQHNQPTFEGKEIQEILGGIVGDEMNSFKGDTYEYADFLGVDSFNLQTTKNVIDLVRLRVFGVKSFWTKSLAAEDIWYCSRRIKYSKYLFLWCGKVQYQGQSSMDNLSKRRLCLGGFHQTIGIRGRILPNPVELMQEHLLDFLI
ncbi:unnamed protein product [Prunus armeniaca]